MDRVWILVVAAALAGCGGAAPLTPTDGGGDGASGTLCPAAGRPALPSGTCAVTPGGGGLLITGTLLLPGQVLRGGQVAVDGTGKITCVDCDCSVAAAGATQIDCPTGVISPGLINTHDHITYAQDPPIPDSGERFEQRSDWRVGLRGHTQLQYGGAGTAEQTRWGELRFVLGGATSTVGGGSAPGLVRNLDTVDQEGLGKPSVIYEIFPLGDYNGNQLTSSCAYQFVDTGLAIKMTRSFEPHIAEGIDHVANNEFLCTSSTANGGQDLAQPQSAFIHSVGLRSVDYQLEAKDGTSIVWSPRSNIRLYGDTARITVAARAGAQIALGTDWTPSGSINLLRELRCADSFNQTYLDHFFTDEDLWKMVTVNAAGVTATADVIGTLATGMVADIAIFDGAVHADHRAVIAADAPDVVLVLRGGKVLYGDAEVVGALVPSGCDPLPVCGRTKSICLQPDVGETPAQLTTNAGAVYPAFFCDTPDGEPTCTPTRGTSVAGSTVYTGQPSASDSDGDGIPDASDNCPKVWNPIRPLDDGAQPDADSDGIGDACDPTP